MKNDKSKDPAANILQFGGRDQETELPSECVPQNHFVVLPHSTEHLLVHRLPTHPLTRREACELAAFLVHYAEDRYHKRHESAHESAVTMFLTALRLIRRNAK